MCELVAMSARYATNLTLSLRALSEHSSSGGHVDGWGVAYYGDRDARRIRDTTAAHGSPWARFVAEQGLTSRLVIAHIRKATEGAVALENTQPFERELGGHIHVFAHNGDLPRLKHADRYRGTHYRPVGDTDSEIAFCYLLDRLRELWRDSVPADFDLRWRLFRDVCDELRPMGPANILYSDSEHLFVHGNLRTQEDGERRAPGLHWLCRECRHENEAGVTGEAISVRDPAPGSSGLQRVALVASVPLTDEPWVAMAEGEMLAIRAGRVVAREAPERRREHA